MQVRISHYQPHESGDELFSVRVLAAQRCILPDARLSKYARYEQLRVINWQRTFARRGLNSSDYSSMKEFPTGVFHFEHKAFVGGVTKDPWKVAFTRTGDLENVLQNEVVTYAGEELMLPATVESKAWLHVPEAFFRKPIAKTVPDGFYKGQVHQWYHTDVSWLTALKSQYSKVIGAAKAEVELIDRMLTSWGPDSFVEAHTASL